MLKWVGALMLVLLMAMPVTAQKVVITPTEVAVFDSPQLLVTCVAQFVMGDTALLARAVISGRAKLIPKGTKIMVIAAHEDGMMAVIPTGMEGTWFTAIQFFGR